MALAIDTIDGRGLSNEARHELQDAVFVVHFTVKGIYSQLYITNKTECFSFKSGHAVRVVKLIKEDWPIVLQ